MSWFLVTLFLSLTLSSVSEANHDTKHPSAAFVVGTVYCDTCFQQDFSMTSHFISGASIAVECKDGSSKPRFRKEAKTNEHGKFKVELPFSVSKHVKRIKGCTVKVINSSEPYCAVASAATSSSLRLKSRRPGEHVFSAGFFSFKPLKQPTLCNQKPSIQNSKEFDSVKSAFPPIFPPPIQDPTTPGGLLPTLPKLPGIPPLPELPPLPSLPRVPWAPSNPGRAEDSSTAKSSNKPQFSDRKVARPGTFPLPPIPFQPPPFYSIPNPSPNPSPFQSPPLNPLQPPSTSPLDPNPLQPPQSGQFPPVPGLTPSPPPALPVPFPPFFLTPPASTSENSSP